MHLRNPVTGLMKKQGYGEGYKYSHDHPEHFAAMENLPERLQRQQYYVPSGQGYEQEVAQRIQHWWGDKKGGAKEPPKG
jgi:putative ATPase